MDQKNINHAISQSFSIGKQKRDLDAATKERNKVPGSNLYTPNALMLRKSTPVFKIGTGPRADPLDKLIVPGPG